MTEPHTARSRAAYYNNLVAPYVGPDTRRSLVQLLVTVVGFVGCWYAMLRSLEVNYVLTLLLAFPTAGFLARMFMIQHDLGHGSFFPSRRVSRWIGHWIGVLTLLPYDYWRRTHAHHHAHSGDLDSRGFGDVETLTVQEYLSLSKAEKLRYRIYRHPLVMFGLGPLWHFGLKQRYPWGVPRTWKKAWRSVWLTNLGIAGAAVGLALAIGWQRLLLVHGPVVVLTCTIGVWLFYIQHQFESTYWEHNPDWDFYEAALEGSSHLVLPAPLQWITASIGLHHLHHLSPRIPNYRLQECLDGNPELEAGTRLTLRGSLALTRLHLWDSDAKRLISFRELRRRVRPA